MATKKYEIRYLPTFISQFNNILYYITYELKNKIAAGFISLEASLNALK